MLVITDPSVIPAWMTGVPHSTPPTSAPELTSDGIVGGTEVAALFRQLPLLLPCPLPKPPNPFWSAVFCSCCCWALGLVAVLAVDPEAELEVATVTPRKAGSPIWMSEVACPARIWLAMDSARLIGIAKPMLAPVPAEL